MTQPTYLYPGATGGAADPCQGCSQTRPHIAFGTPHGLGSDLMRLCRECHADIAAGRPAQHLPTREAMPEVLQAWARWDFNEEVTPDLTVRMLASLIPDLPEITRLTWFRNLQGALLEAQSLEGGTFDLMSVEPEARDWEALMVDAQAKVRECVAALVAAAQFGTERLTDIRDVGSRVRAALDYIEIGSKTWSHTSDSIQIRLDHHSRPGFIAVLEWDGDRGWSCGWLENLFGGVVHGVHLLGLGFRAESGAVARAAKKWLAAPVAGCAPDCPGCASVIKYLAEAELAPVQVEGGAR